MSTPRLNLKQVPIITQTQNASTISERASKKFQSRILSLLISAAALLSWQSTVSAQSIVNDFGTGSGSFTTNNTSSTSFIPNPSVGTATTYARVPSGTIGGGVFIENSRDVPIGCNSVLRAIASSGGNVTKASPVVSASGAATVAYVKFNVELGTSTGGNNATSGTWSMYMGNGSMYSNTGDFTSNQVFCGLQFVFGNSGAITTSYRNGGNWTNINAGITQGTSFTIELFMNNSGNSFNYNYGGSQSVNSNRFDLWVNGNRIGNDINKGDLSGGTNLNALCFIGNSSSSNVANIFVDDLEIFYTIPSNVSRSSVAISTPGVASSNVAQGTQNTILQSYALTASSADAILNGLTVTTAGNYNSADLTALNLILSTNSTLDASDVLLQSLATPGNAGNKTFNFACQTIPSGSTYYLFVTANLPCNATTGRTMSIASTSFTNINFVESSLTGTNPVAAGGTRTIVASTATAIGTQPTATTVCIGAPINLSVTASGTNLTYQWRKGGTNISGANSSTYTIASAVAGDAGNYDVIVTGQCGAAVTSNSVAVTVSGATAAPGTISGTASSCQGASGVSYTVAAVSGATSYTWSYSGTGATITGSTNTVTVAFSNTATSGNLTVRANNSCTSSASSPALAIAVGSTPFVTNMTSSVCSGTAVTVTPTNGTNGTIPSGTTFTWPLPTGTGFTGAAASSAASASLSQTLTNSGSSPVTAVYTLTPLAGTCQGATFTVSITVNPRPNATITQDLCSVGGAAVLSVPTGAASYSWSNGATASSTSVNMAGSYSVTITNSFGCSNTATTQVAQELVVNGTFENGNTGFNTGYTFRTDLYTGGTTGLISEGAYAINSNANLTHPNFWGRDHTTGNGNFMIINGSPTVETIWATHGVTVQPNTTYYFSAHAMSVNDAAPFAQLQFSINGSQVGTIATLTAGPTNNAGPFNWVQFYGQWNSGPATVADISIVNLQLALGGNDFGLDDISFATLSPTLLAAAPAANGGTGTCLGSPLTLTSNISGGISPFTYSWTGPNGFTSSSATPVVSTAATAAQTGTYTLVVTDGSGCTENATISVAVNALPNDVTAAAAAASVCSNTSTNITIASSETGISYQLMNAADDALIGIEVTGTGASISLPTGLLTAATTFKVRATRYTTGCVRILTSQPTVSVSTTPVLNLNNQNVCSGAVNLTLPAVTAGSTGGGTLSYWTNATATTALNNPSAVTAPGTYFIRSVLGSCSDIEPVSVFIGTTSGAAFSYSGSPFCTSGTNPAPVFTGSNVAGTFTSTAGLVFVAANTGRINLAASTPGTYTITNTVTPTGGCSSSTATTTVTITRANNASFSYTSNGLCQAANANNPAPIFASGAAAGTFSSTAGVTFVSTSTGVINLAATTPGNYAIVNTVAANAGCPSVTDTVFVDINPYTFEGSVSASSSVSTVCEGLGMNLFSSATGYLTVLERERFNGSINNWVTANNSTGGTPTASAWTLRPAGFSISGTAMTSNDATQCYISDARSQGSGTVSTWLRSPALSSVGFTTLSLDFFHFYDDRNASNAKVQISTNGSSWTDLVTYTDDTGSNNNFANAVINLNSYVGLPTFYIRFLYTAAGGDRYWCIDNVSITGMSTNYTYSWASSPSGYTAALQNPTNVIPAASTFYIATATNAYGCSVPAIPVGVTVNPKPADNAGADVISCGGTAVGIGAPSTANRTYSWSPSTGLSSATVANPSATPAATTTYTLTETNTTTGCSASNSVLVTVRQVAAVNNMNIAACSGSSFSSIPQNGANGTIPLGTTYTWTAPTGTGFSGGTAQSTPQSSILQTLTLTGLVSTQAVYTMTPVTNGCNGPSFTLTVNITPSSTIVTQPVSPGPMCLNNSTATISVVASGNNLTYQWNKGVTNLNNNSLYSGTTTPTLTITNPAATDAGLYFVRVTGQCGNPVTSGYVSIVVNTPVTPTISIASSAGSTACEGNNVTFTATITNGGTTPTYLWRVNGNPIAGATSSTLIKNDLQNGDVVTCALTSSISCVTSSTVVSNAITMSVVNFETPQVEISTPATSGLCAGTPVTYTATPTFGGTTPVYQWRRNNTVVGTNSPTLTINNLTNSDVIRCVLTSNRNCVAQNNVLSNSISLNIQNAAAPVISITSENSGNACPGSNITFVASAANAGSTPAYQWHVNGDDVGTNSPNFISSSLVAGDAVTCTVTSSLSCASPESANSTAVTIIYTGAIQYFPDTDEDGYGATSGGILSCTPVVGYVTNNFDCNDGNIDINPGTDEWYNLLDDNCDGSIDETGGGAIFYRDIDGDNYGNESDTLRSFSLPFGYCLHDGDCNDNNALVNPSRAEICNGIDDDCDGTIDEGCGPLNDETTSSLTLNMPNYPDCSLQNGTLSGATISASGSGATTTGADVWYRFVAPHPGVRIQAFSNVNDIAIELRNSSGVVLKTENSQGIGNEVLNFGGLTAGEAYFVGVRNLNGATAGGSFSICGSALRASYFTASNGTYSLCDNINSFYTVANQYTVRFTNTANSSVTVFNTAANSTLIPLSNCVGLSWGGSYSVRVDAVYSLTRGNGNLEVITVQGSVLRNISIATSAVTSVRTSDTCPNVKLLSSTLTLAGWVCGAVDYQWEFTRTLPSTAAPVVVSRGTSSTTLPLNLVQGLTPNSSYTVRVRGVLPNNIFGTWSAAQCVTIGGTTALEILPTDESVNQQHSLRTKRDTEDEGMTFYLFPNPSDGTTVFLNIENMTAPNFTVRLTDHTGRVVYNQLVQATGNMRLALNLEGQVSSGSYQLEIQMNNSFKVKRLIVVENN